MLTVGLVLLVTLVASEALAVATVMPKVEADLGDIWLYGWVFSAFFLGNLVGIVVAGKASDRMKPVIPFAVGAVLFVAGLLLGGLAGSMALLVAARVLQGVGAGALPTVAYVAIGREYPPDARPRMFALMSTAWVVPSLIGPGLAAVVGEQFGWRWVFLGLVPIVVVCGLAVVGSVSRIAAPATPAEGGSNLRDALLVALGAGLTLGGLAESRVLVALPLTAVGLGVMVTAFRRLTPPGTLRARVGLPATILIKGVLTFAFFQADAYVPLALTSVRGTSILFAGLAVTACSLLWTVGSWVQERRIHRTGPRPLVQQGFLLTGLGVILLMVTMAPGVPVTLGVVAWAIGGLGIGLAYSPLSVTALALAGPGREGTVSSALQLSDVLGVALGTGIGGVVVAHGARAGWPPRPGILIVFAMALSVSAVGAVLARRLPDRLPRAEPLEEPDAPPTAGQLGAEIDEVVAGGAWQGVEVPDGR
jgi:MFS family permease